ncbi:MAG: helix-turn-helix domain-containing protein [Acidimicrobiales bacterium]
MGNEHGDRDEKTALFRFSVISEAVSPRLSPAERGLIARELAARSWTTPEGTERSFSRVTIDRWVAAYRRDGLSGLRTTPRRDRGMARGGGRWLEEACKMRRQLPTRSAAQIVDAIFRAHGVALSERTVRAHLRRAGLSRKALTADPTRAFGRFEASRPNEIWIGDVLHGPFVPHPRVAGSKRAKLFLLVDDHSRLIGPLDDRGEHPGGPRRAALGDRPPRPARAPVRRQRGSLCQPPARPGVRGARHPPRPQPALQTPLKNVFSNVSHTSNRSNMVADMRIHR